MQLKWTMAITYVCRSARAGVSAVNAFRQKHLVKICNFTPVLQ